MLEVKGLQTFFDKSPGPRIGFKGQCHDCKKSICIDVDMAPDGKVTVRGGALYSAQTGLTPEDTTFFLKCDTCFGKDAELKNFRPCEIYSRVVGFLRPVRDWNPGKKAEFGLRNTYKI